MRVAVFLADGFEEIEAISSIDILRRAEICVDMVSIYNRKTVKGAHGIEMNSDKLIDEVSDFTIYDGLVIPGGLPGATNLRDCKKVIEAVKTLNDLNKLVSAICAGPSVLQRAGVLSGKKATCYPGFESEVSDAEITGSGTERDGNIITGKGPAFAMDFAIELVKYLLGESKAEEIKSDLLKV